MRGRAALVLSLVGVAGAGVAAGLVNDSVLRGDDRGAAVVEPPVTNPVVGVDSTTATTAARPTASTSTPPSIASTVVSTSTSLTATTVAPTTLPAGATVQPFTLGEGATVIVDTADGRLDLVDIAPHPGWEVEHIDAPTHSQLVIDLESIAGVQTRFEMSVVHGIVSLHEVPVPPDDDDAGSDDGDDADEPDDPDDDHSGPGGGGDEPDDDADDSDHGGSGRSGGDD